MTAPGIRMRADYTNIVGTVLRAGRRRRNDRTGQHVIETWGETVRIECGKGIQVPGLRRVSVRLAAVELAWMILGRRDVKWLEDRSCGFWTGFDENGIVEGAYGWRWRNHFELPHLGVFDSSTEPKRRDQLTAVIEELRADQSSRQAVLCAWDPAIDGMTNALPPHGGIINKNIPCPAVVVVGISPEEKVNLHLTIRSSDVMVGLPYDLLVYQLLQAALAAEFFIEPGTFTAAIANKHIYERDLPVAKTAWKLQQRGGSFHAPKIAVREIAQDPDAYIYAITEASRGTGATFYKKLEAVQ